MKPIDKLLALCIALIWGVNFVVVRWGLEDVNPLIMTILRFLLTAIPMIFFVKRPDVPMKYVALYGVLFGGGVWGLVNIAVWLGMTAGMASLLLQLSPFLTVIVASLVFHEPFNVKKLIGIAVAFIGFITICLVNPSGFSPLPLILMLLSAAFWTICNSIIKVTKPKDAISFTVWSSVFVPIPLLILTVIYSSVADISLIKILQLPNWKGWVSILFQAVVATLFGYGGWSYLISKHGLSNIVLYSLIVPIAGLICGWLFYSETLSHIEIFGSILVVMGLVIVNFPKRNLTKNPIS